MDAFFNYFYTFMKTILGYLWAIILAIWNAIVGILDIPFYVKLFDSYKDDLSPLGWVMALIVHIIVLIIFALIIFLIVKGIRFLFKFKVPVVEYERMKDEVVTLKREMMKMSYEKDKILAMKVSGMGMAVNPDLMNLKEEMQVSEEDKNIKETVNAEQESKVQTTKSENDSTIKQDNIINDDSDNGDIEESEIIEGEKVEKITTTELRFPRLSAVDRFYAAQDFKAPEYRTNYSLEEICIDFRNYAASRLGLYYELEVIKQVFASIGAAKMLILQGISGTGKTSLPYALGQFIENPSLICSVQPSWRDRTELFGYYNDFTKKYSETEFLKTLYEAQYQEDLRFVILDEMNIARVEYYFAEMLSILELPRPEERFISVVSSSTDSDPDKMEDGKVWIPSNIFYVGTINNDDSTFAVADKVYDRAIPIDLDDRANVFDAVDTPPMRVKYTYLESLYEKAKEDYPVSEEVLLQLDQLDKYLIEHFRLTFGNRILRQIKSFVPCYVACGGTEIDGVDFMFAKKILRKFESLGLGFIRDELDGLIVYLQREFGEDNMKISRAYLARLKKMSGA